MDADWTLLSVLGKPVVHSHDRLSALLRVHIGQEAQALLAEPVFAEAPAADGGADLRRPIGWRSPRGGALTPLSAAANPGLLRDRFARLEREITALCARLSTQGEAGQSAAESLRLALITPEGGAWLYADHDQPVLVCWGLGRPGQAIAAGAVGALSGAARAAAASAVSGSAAPVAPSPVGGAASPPPAGSPPPAEGAGSSPVAPAPGRRAWIAPALLALALLLLAGWLAWRALTPLAPVIVEAPAEAPADLSRLDDLGRTLAQLDQALGEARLAEDAFQKACVVPPEPTPEPTPAPPAAAPAPQPDPLPDRAEGSPPPPAEAAPPEVKPEAPPPAAPAKPKPPITAAKPPAKVAPPAPAPAEPPAQPASRAACEPSWSPGREPRMIFVVDGSGSMSEGIAGAPSRISAAKRSIRDTVNALHKDIRVGMVSFSDCMATQNSKYYSAAERPAFLAGVDAITPERATSLAASIRRGGALATRRSETVMMVVSDGEDTCGGDPCAAARAVKAEKSNVIIHVIDLSGGGNSGVARCIASAGGGRVFTPGSAAQVTSSLRTATGQPDASGCQ